MVLNLCQNYYFNDDDLKRYEKILLNQGIKIKFKSIDFINKINSIPEFDTLIIHKSNKFVKL